MWYWEFLLSSVSHLILLNHYFSIRNLEIMMIALYVLYRDLEKEDFAINKILLSLQ